jgi:hypothetical protein
MNGNAVWVASVEDLQPYTIPTLSKTKISHYLSYPIGVSAVSEALRSAAQLPEMKLHFYFWFDHGLRVGHYELLRVEYLNDATPAEEYPTRRLYTSISVHPNTVGKSLSSRYHESFATKSSATSSNLRFPRLLVGFFFSNRAELVQPGSDKLTSFYDEKTGEFQTRPLTQLEPLRSSS